MSMGKWVSVVGHRINANSDDEQKYMHKPVRIKRVVRSIEKENVRKCRRGVEK
jgi:hypothetical protein